MKSQKNLPQKIEASKTESRAVSRNKAFAVLKDFNLDRRIAQLIQTVEAAFADHETAHETIQTAHETISRSEKSAVKGAWSLGKHLIEKKRRLPHGAWEQWLATTDISLTTAKNYMTMASQIVSADDLKPSIRSTLESLPALAAAKPKSVPEIVPVAVIKPATATPKALAVAVVKPDLGPEPDAETIDALEKELYAEREKVAGLEERSAIMEEAASPESREVFDKINNQAELVKTLKASIANVQAKNTGLLAQLKALKRRNKALEATAANRPDRDIS